MKLEEFENDDRYGAIDDTAIACHGCTGNRSRQACMAAAWMLDPENSDGFVAVLDPDDMTVTRRIKMTTANEILSAKAAAGDDAYLWLHDSGDCILWPTEEASTNDDGKNALDRWQISSEVAAELIDSGEVDEVA